MVLEYNLCLDRHNHYLGSYLGDGRLCDRPATLSWRGAGRDGDLHYLSGTQELPFCPAGADSSELGIAGEPIVAGADLPNQSDPILYLAAERLLCECAA